MKNRKILPLFLLGAISSTLVSCGGAPGGGNGKYTLTLNPCFNDDYIFVRGNEGETIDLGQYVPSNVKNGYTFSGWSTSYSSSSGYGTNADIVSSYTFKTSNETLYGSYKISQEMTEGVKQYMANLAGSSQDGHLYYHYYRFDNEASSYADWDVWAWAYKPSAGEGAKFDWVGRTTSSNLKTATGNATIGQYGGAYIDIDLTKTYNGGWNSKTRIMGGTDVSFVGATQVGLQIAQTSSRDSAGGFWTNDGSNLFIKLDDYKMALSGGGTAYHVFVVQDDVQNPSTYPVSDVSDPFANDDGKNVTYGDSRYDNVSWSSEATKYKTSEDFKEAGVGYQIMVSSFADSDGDGFGDIYGITQKIPYLKDLGVKALWLTPIQLSDSYHGYDITDYEKVDPKFGSSKSPAGISNGGEVTSESALEDYKELINTAHNNGIKIVMDLVLNHTSTSNKWFVSSANLDENYRGYYQWGNHKTNTTKINQNNNWYPYGDHPYSYYAKFGSSMPELNFSYKSTREAVEDMSVYWTKDVGVDGFRLDAVKHIFMENEVSSTSGDTIVYDKSSSGDYSSDLTKNLHFFRELKKVVSERTGRNIFFVGENFDGHAYHVAPYYEAFDSLFDFYTYFNMTSSAATGRKNSTSGFGTASGFMSNTSTYTISADNSSTSGVRDSGNKFSTANNKAWNFPAVYGTYNAYRGDTSLPGVFTSNHDIARVINRIAGTGNAEGLQKQGNVTTSNYADYEKSADCVKIAELMFPGLTWIYYGDEIGMTGNFPTGKDADSDFADLWYRQPMKWANDGYKGDSNGTTSYYVTGSSTLVEQDSVNKSSAVTGALSQQSSSTSEFAVMKKFINLKTRTDNVGKALRYGSIAYKYYVNGNLASNVMQFDRVYNGTTVKVIVNFNASQQSVSNLSGTILASYNNATLTSMPAYSAIVVQG